MSLTYDERVHLVPLSKSRERMLAQGPDLEWSEFERSSRFVPGWYIVPALLTGAGFLIGMFGLIWAG